MKITKIRIEGMHDVLDKTYTFGDITYINGKNGAGKSTILQAIQLGLLGYIPGYPKTNEGVFRHARSKCLSVTLTLDDGGVEFNIVRSWTADGQSVKYSETIPPALNLNAILQDIELPVFNFNDFTGLSANKMKEWFIAFLPDSDDSKIDWRKELTDSLGDLELTDSGLIDRMLDKISEYEKPGVSSVDVIKSANNMFKESEQYTKGEIDSLNKTIQSLTYYSDLKCGDEQELENQIAELSAKRDKVIQYNTAVSQRNTIVNKLANIEVLAGSYGEDMRVPKLNESITSSKAKIDELNGQIDELKNQLREADINANSYSGLANSSGLCPYTQEACKTAESKISEAKKAKAKADKACNEIRDKLNGLSAELNKAKSEYTSSSDSLRIIESNYREASMLSGMLKDLPEDPGVTLQEVTDSITQLTADLNKLKANNVYKRSIDTFTMNKFGYESNIKAYKIWTKLTGPNGLQNRVVSGPFDALTADMNKHLSAMFNEPTECKFNLSEKANSFSFGIMRDDKYILFETLSAGERCLYTLALLSCIIERTNSPVKLLIVDDLVDHLDDANAEFLFNSLANIKDIQIVLAGVKPCNIDSIKLSV